jgi:hypothetical protein
MPDSWNRFYKLKWYYDIYSKPPVGLPAELIEMRRANPDTSIMPWWCWKSRYWSVPVYKNANSLRLSESIIKWWDQTTGAISIKPPDDWTAFFGEGIHQNEHPHEITAEFLSGPLFDNAIPSDAPPAMKILRKAWTDGNTQLFPEIISQ